MKRTKEELIKYRIQRAFESLEEAKILSQNGHWNTVANRLYYSCFYMVSALLAQSNILSKSHSGIKTEFHKTFIKTAIFEKELGKLYSELFDDRQEGDYQDFYFLTKEDIEPKMQLTEEFLQIIESYIKSN